MSEEGGVLQEDRTVGWGRFYNWYEKCGGMAGTKSDGASFQNWQAK